MGTKLSLRRKLLLQFLAMGIVPMAAMAGLALVLNQNSLKESILSKIESISHVKQKHIEGYFNTIRNQMITFSEDKMIIDAAKEFKANFYEVAAKMTPEEIEQKRTALASFYNGPFAEEYRKQNNGADPTTNEWLNKLDANGVAMQHLYILSNNNPLGQKHKLDAASDGSSYSKVHSEVHPVVRSFLEKFGYYDIFIVDADTGNVMYSVFKELDFGTNLLTGSYKDTNFAEVFRIARDAPDKDFVRLIDFKQYAPSYENPAGFIASPIQSEGKNIAVAIFQMPLDQINNVTGERSGMGETGETLLVGGDLLPRSNSFLDKDARTVAASYKSKGEAAIRMPEIDAALKGNSTLGEALNYLGQEALVATSPLKIADLNWVIMVQMGQNEALAPVRKLAEWIASITGASILVTIILGLYIGRSIAGPIIHIASELFQNSKQVAQAAEGLAGSSGQLSELAAEQASSIEETAASIEEISAMVKNNVEQAERTSNLSDEVKSVADQGNQSMQALIQSMEEIIASNHKISELVHVIGEIGEKTSVIDEIVFQTKLLSFNASVEAERAGEHGRGFAVVAQEVGNLAQMSGKAAAEIAQMVKTSVRNAESITAQNKSKVEHGNGLVLEAAKHLRDIAANAEMMLKQAQQITNSSKEQFLGISQINEAMNQLDRATQQNAALSEETASSSEELAGQADNLKDNVNSLLVIVEGSHAKGTATLAPVKQSSSTRVGQKEKSSEAAEGTVVAIESRRKFSTPPPASTLKKVAGDAHTKVESTDEWEKL